MSDVDSLVTIPFVLGISPMNNSEHCLHLDLGLDPLSVVGGTIAPPKTRPCQEFRFGVWWQRLVKTLARANELQVWQRCDRLGNCYWNAYDPATGRSITAGSAAEIRAWIEEGRYQK
jgi:hypothetical protein